MVRYSNFETAVIVRFGRRCTIPKMSDKMTKQGKSLSMKIVKPERYSTFQDVLKLANKLAQRPSKLTSRVFRGQEDASWGLSTNLERQLKNFEIPLRDAPKIERGLLRKFRRHCENYISNVPDWGNYPEWFALMRHYGAPTRLLDCTYSFFVALFFAVEQAKNDFAVWALDAAGFDDKACNVLGPQKSRLIKCGPNYDPNLQFAEDFRKIFMSQPKMKFVCATNPYKFNERLVAQQGVFLCPGDISRPFEENLVSMFKSPKDLNRNAKKYVFKYSVNLKKEIIFYLQRMNINRATLFPGLQGFAESLSTLLSFPNLSTVLPEDSAYVCKRYASRWPGSTSDKQVK